ncbi:YnbE family lipoprotein [Novosphingobium sp. MW5]|nr:YnbE family lipoprotein [Novosphingobium sp. MW5]
MMHQELTGCASLAKVPAMSGYQKGKRFPGRRTLAAAVLVGGVMALSGCVSVEAPDKPIVIELNINIKQEVVYRLAQDAQKTVKENGDIF